MVIDFSNIKFEKVNSEDYYELYHKLVQEGKDPFSYVDVKFILIKDLLKKFNLSIDCNSLLLEREIKDNFDKYEFTSKGIHRIYGKDEFAIYEILIDESDEHNFLEYRMTRLNQGPSLIYIYDKEGEIVLLT